MHGVSAGGRHVRPRGGQAIQRRLAVHAARRVDGLRRARPPAVGRRPQGVLRAGVRAPLSGGEKKCRAPFSGARQEVRDRCDGYRLISVLVGTPGGVVLIVGAVLIVGSVPIVGDVLVVGSVPIVGGVLMVGSGPPVPDVSVLTAIPPHVAVVISALVGVVPVGVPTRFVARVTSSVTMGLAGETGCTGAVKSFDSRRAWSTEIDWGRAGSGPGPAFTVMLSRTPTGVAGPTAVAGPGSRREARARPRRL